MLLLLCITNLLWIILFSLFYFRKFQLFKVNSKPIHLLNIQQIEIDQYKLQIHKLEEQILNLKMLSIVTEQTENAVMLMDAEGNIIWVNNSFERMYEYSYSEFISKLGDNIKKTSFNPKIVERLNRCISSKRAVTYEALNITKSGKQLWTHTSLIPLVNDDDKVIGLVTIDSDVHKRISASEALIEYNISFKQKLEKISEQVSVMFELTNLLFERIDKSQNKIDQTDRIITYVKGISDQTKILGINASIEAYSAGNKGNGFRVIASEMVSISNLTLQSLKEINDLISSVKRSSDKLGNEREKSEAAINLHRSLIDELRKELNEVEQVVYQLKE